jgi:hypothetical protein
MQVSKVAVVATGALATAAAMGSTPAFAVDSEGTPAVAPATVGVLDYEGKHRASDEAMRELAEYWLTVAPEQTWAAPWDQEPPQILSLGSGSALSALSWQICGSSVVAGVGATVPIASPNTVLGDCTNGNVDIQGNGGDDALFSILDNSALSLAPWQICGSSTVAGVGLTAPVASPNTVKGDCTNGNIKIDTTDDEGKPTYPDYPEYPDQPEYPDYPYDSDDSDGSHDSDGQDMPEYPYPDSPGYDYYEPAEAATAVEERAVVPEAAPWEQEPPQILSAGSGSAASALSWQVCGSSAVAGVGGTVPVASPNTALGDCTNGNLDIHGNGGDDALFSVLDNSALSVAPWQVCGSSVVAGVGGTVPIASPNTVIGDCTNGNIRINTN